MIRDLALDCAEIVALTLFLSTVAVYAIIIGG